MPELVGSLNPSGPSRIQLSPSDVSDLGLKGKAEPLRYHVLQSLSLVPEITHVPFWVLKMCAKTQLRCLLLFSHVQQCSRPESQSETGSRGLTKNAYKMNASPASLIVQEN